MIAAAEIGPGKMDSKRTRLANVVSTIWAGYGLSVIAIALLACSTYFFIAAQRFRARMNANNPDLFRTGQIVDVLAVIDGDEILIGDTDGNSTTKLRLLGIKSFNPTASDPLLSEYGKICFDYLKAVTVDQRARLEVAPKRRDNEGRLLGTLYLRGPKRAYNVDLADELLRNGYTLVYTRFDFERMGPYLRTQDEAKREKAGFWSNEGIAARATSLMTWWEEQKKRDG